MEAYMNSLNQAANMSISTPRNGHQGSQQQMASPEEVREVTEFANIAVVKDLIPIFLFTLRKSNGNWMSSIGR